jgi:hypothetical protein
MHGGDQKCIKISAGRHEGKRPFRRPRHRWENNMTMDLRETQL